MYRLFNFKNNVQSLQSLVFHSSNIPSSKHQDVHQRICSLCHKLHSLPNVFSRNQSTSTNPSVKPKRPRKKRKNKTYADVLVVTNKSTMQQKATIKKLSPSDLKVFATTNLNLSEMYKLQDVKNQLYIEEHTYNNLAIFNDIGPIEPDMLTSTRLSDIIHELRVPSEQLDIARLDNASILQTVSPEPIIKEVKQLDILPNNKDDQEIGFSEAEVHELCGDEPSELHSLSSAKPLFHPETLDDDHHEPDTETHKSRPVEMDRTAREEIISRTLAAYIEVCAYLNTPQRGLNALIFHRTRTKAKINRFFPSVKSINIYNALLRGFAIKGNFPKVQEVLEYAKEDNVTLNVQSYAIVFECLGRINVKDNYLKQIRIFSKDAFRQGFTFDKIMNESVFLSDQRSVTLKAMKSFDPSYNVCIRKPNVQYSNRLVNSLNNDLQLEPPKIETKVLKDSTIQNLIKKQLEFEKVGYITIKSVEAKPNPTEEIVKYREIFADHVKLWEKAALQGFTRDLLALTARRGVLTIEPYLRTIPTKDFVQIIVDEAKKIAQGSETYSPTCGLLYRELGSKVYARYKVLRKQKMAVLDKILDIHSEYCAQYQNLPEGTMNVTAEELIFLNSRQRWQWIEYLHKNNGSTILTNHQSWVPTVIQNVGKFLYQIIMQDLKIDVNAMRTSSKHRNFLPAFYTIFRTENHVMKEEIKPHPVLSKLYRASVPETLTFSSADVPMLCPPIPWCSPTTGGYLVAPCDMVRIPYQATIQKQRLYEAPSATLYPSIDSLNQLSMVPWKVNTKVLDVILEVFNSGGSAQLDVPEHSSSIQPLSRITPEMSKSQKYQLFRQRMQQKRKKAEMYSLWCDCLYRLSLANHFRNDVFWLPHNMDFRGRVYPIPPHLNHLGSDLARSILVFAEARPLGRNGLDWLKLHLVNLTGLKKRDCIHDRLVFANEIMDKVLDSADYPLTGKKWWAESDEPWQTLACCMEIAAAHRSDNPEEFLSSFPVHQDGSCNGLQHYAALGRDSAGAHSVNLTPSRSPQDVYNAVVILVEKQREKDAANGIAIAKVLNGFIKRKVIKQTIMTTVYGVTRYGARLQIARQLKDIDDFPKEHVWAASNYLTACTFESLRTMFTSTREIQDWFTDCARLISSLVGQNVEWVTPLGLPIVQPYTRYNKFSSGAVYESFHMDKFE